MKIKMHKIYKGDPCPSQLKIEGGKIVSIDGTEPDFSDLPDGPVIITPKQNFEKLLDSALLERYHTA